MEAKRERAINVTHHAEVNKLIWCLRNKPAAAAAAAAAVELPEAAPAAEALPAAAAAAAAAELPLLSPVWSPPLCWCKLRAEALPTTRNTPSSNAVTDRAMVENGCTALRKLASGREGGREGRSGDW